jgi:3-dehydroquinate synthase
MSASRPASILQTRFRLAYAYPVFFGEDFLRPSDDTLARVLASKAGAGRVRVLFAVDEGLAARRAIGDELSTYAAAHRLEMLGAPVSVPGGERCKNEPSVLDRLHATLHELRVDRHAFVVVVGGGAVLDVVGYAAATAHRGVRLVRFPSTTLSQCDSGVGVKNGVNRFGKKNFLGTFAPPVAVLNDASLLRTLDARDLRAGYAEAVKVAILKSPGFFSWLQESADALREGEPEVVGVLVRTSAAIHVEHIATSGDAFESGSSRPLDLGHWAAHKLEALTDGELRHGEAVAIGIALDATYSALAGLCDGEVATSIVALLARLGRPIAHEALRDARLLEGLEEFREHLGGALSIPLPAAIGRCTDARAMDGARIVEAAARLLSSSLHRRCAA